MKLKKTTLFAILGFFFLFIIKTANSLHTKIIFKLIDPPVLLLLSMLSYLFIILFFYSLFRKYAKSGSLKAASLLTAIGFLFQLLLDLHIIAFHQNNTFAKTFGIGFPFILLIILCYFFITFARESGENLKLRLSAFVALGSIVLSLVIYLILMFNFYLGRKLTFNVSLGIIIFTLIFFTHIYFYIIFYREIDALK